LDHFHHVFDVVHRGVMLNPREQVNPHAGVNYLALMGAMKQDVMDVCFYLPSLCSNRY
jgi:hypothetical protein